MKLLKSTSVRTGAASIVVAIGAASIVVATGEAPCKLFIGILWCHSSCCLLEHEGQKEEKE